MKFLIFFKGKEKGVDISEVKSVKIFKRGNCEIFTENNINNFRIKSGSDLVFETSQLTLTTTADAVSYITYQT